jgi:hypothetical protein
MKLSVKLVKRYLINLTLKTILISIMLIHMN